MYLSIKSETKIRKKLVKCWSDVKNFFSSVESVFVLSNKQLKLAN